MQTNCKHLQTGTLETEKKKKSLLLHDEIIIFRSFFSFLICGPSDKMKNDSSDPSEKSIYFTNNAAFTESL